MKPNREAIEVGRFWRARRYARPQWLTVLVTVAIIVSAQIPRIAAAEVALVAVDVAAVATVSAPASFVSELEHGLSGLEASRLR